MFYAGQQSRLWQGRISACNQDQGITVIPKAPLPALPTLLPVSTYYIVFFGLTHEVE